MGIVPSSSVRWKPWVPCLKLKQGQCIRYEVSTKRQIDDEKFNLAYVIAFCNVLVTSTLPVLSALKGGLVTSKKPWSANPRVDAPVIANTLNNTCKNSISVVILLEWQNKFIAVRTSQYFFFSLVLTAVGRTAFDVSSG